MTRLSVSTDSVDGFAAQLRESGRGVSRRAGLVARKVGKEMESTAKSHAPVDTGYLRNSIHANTTVTDDAATIELRAEAHYAMYVEFGTSRMGPQPFMRPAFDRHVPTLEQAIRAAGGDL